MLLSFLFKELHMTNPLKPEAGGASRRDFLKTTTVAAGVAAAAALFPSGVHAAGNDAIRVGLIGCGGRGTGASDNVLHSAPNVSIVALADAFEDRLNGCLNFLTSKAAQEDRVKELGNKVDIPKERCFVGLDAYQKLLETDVNYVILATPPGFRPIHLRAAAEAGKTIFTEKPVGVDGPGIRSVLETAEIARKKNLAVVSGTQRRHQLGYVESMKRIHEGEMGDVTSGRAYWNQGVLWFKPHTKDQTEVQYQMRNWYNFPWLCGDHIVEQHIHNLDVMNWGIGATPIRATGMGGRQRSIPNPQDYGVIFDHFAVDYEYPNGVHVLSMCRQIDGCANDVSEALMGTKGQWRSGGYNLNGKSAITKEQEKGAQDPYVQEHTDLIESLRSGKPLNELKRVAESTLTCILGRMSTYTGKSLTWEEALNSKERLMPEKLDWNTELPKWIVAVPGKTPFA
jgi:myo-inositol 2-dehydrogenase/D-chiro-inositol 1-dehydrogenase